uniref:Uncharacterized protein n=1 Tax=Rhizophora mucronata TaxID=61149 RepID=A0A2P2KR64_RHIMU
MEPRTAPAPTMNAHFSLSSMLFLLFFCVFASPLS